MRDPEEIILTPEEVAAFRQLAPRLLVAVAILDRLSTDPHRAAEQMTALLTLSDLSQPLSDIIKRQEHIRFLLSTAKWLVGGFIVAGIATGFLFDLAKWVKTLMGGGSPPASP